jgi:hypothetical protein
LTLIVVFFAIVFLLLGYYAMDKIDKFIENNVLTSNNYLSDEYADNKEVKQKVILIYGDNELTKLIEDYCNSQKYIYEAITDINYISTDYKYICLLALSYIDVDNLMISSIGLKVYSISQVITLCNSQSNLKIYNEFNFDKVLLHGDETDKLFNDIKGWLQDEVKDQI